MLIDSDKDMGPVWILKWLYKHYSYTTITDPKSFIIQNESYLDIQHKCTNLTIDFIDDITFKIFIPTHIRQNIINNININPSIPKLSPTIKIHKKPIAWRPVLRMHPQWYTYPIQKLLAKELKRLLIFAYKITNEKIKALYKHHNIVNNHNNIHNFWNIIVENSVEISNIINKTTIDVPISIGTTDVKSLYPSIEHLQTISANHFFGTKRKDWPRKLHFLSKAFMLVQHTAYTHNDDIIVLQRQGIAMGTCDSPVEANLTLLFYEYNFAEVLANCIVYKIWYINYHLKKDNLIQ